MFNFANDIIAIDPIRIRLWQMSQNEYLVLVGTVKYIENVLCNCLKWDMVI